MKKFNFIFFFILFFVSSFAQNSAKLEPVVIPKFNSEPTIDGKLDDEIWKKAAIFKDFVQINPGENIAPSKDTITRVGYDDKNLYFGFMCFDEPDKIRASVANRDGILGEDNVRVVLDTFNDQRRGYFLAFNPFGVQGDGILSDNQQSGPDLSVDIVMESKGIILENGWSVEVKVPFKSLRYQVGKGKSWGFNTSRVISRLNYEIDSWSHVVREIPSIRQFGKITGLEDIKTDKTLEIVPSITLSKSGERIEDASQPFGSRILNNSIKKDIGVSIKYQITPNITLDAAINPDFAEVEADAPVVRANERFPIFFPEKRPFFLEGNDYFRTPLQVVNTRNIADPDVALKLTGKIGRNTFGVFSAVDRFPDTKTKAYVGVARVKRDIGANSNIGFVATTYHFGGRKHNNLFGVDGKFQTSKKANFNFQIIGTNSNRYFYNPNINDVEYRNGNGFAYNINYDYTGKNRGYIIGANGRSKDYRADAGFTRRFNNHNAFVGWRLGTEPKPENTLIGFTSRYFVNANFDGTGRMQIAEANISTEWDFQKQLQLSSETGFAISKIYEDEFGAKRNANQQGIFFGADFRKANQFYSSFNFDKTFSKKFSLGTGIGFETNSFDFDIGASERYKRVSPLALSTNPRPEDIGKLDPGKALNFSYEINMSFQPIEAWSINATYEREKLRRNDNKLTAFDSNIYSFRSTYQFTRFTFVRTRIDYETVEGSINSQLLFGWSPNPGTAFYAGYNDSSYYRGWNEFRNPNQFDSDFRRDGRRFFIRMSYLFRRSF